MNFPKINITYNNKIYSKADFAHYTVNIKKLLSNLTAGNSVILLCEKIPGLMVLIWLFFHHNIVFVPIDVNIPQIRFDSIYNQVKPNIVIVSKSCKIIPKCTTGVIYLEDLLLGNFDKNNISITNREQRYLEIAYVVFTSGSTGIPKGVMIKKTSVLNLINAMEECIQIKKNETFLSTTVISFDMFIAESIVPIALHNNIVIANEKEQNNPKALIDLLAKHRIDTIQMTPSKLLLMSKVRSISEFLLDVKNILIGGEPAIPKLVDKIRISTKSNLFNMYGPAETTVWSTCCNLSNYNGYSIGWPIKNTKIFILCDNMKEAKLGEVGEIAIGGIGVASGYLSIDDYLTSVKFQSYKGEMIYLTGDLGKCMEDGRIEYIGRKDNQIKVNGYRIELEEIESSINKISYVESAVCFLRKHKENTVLVAAFQAQRKIDVNQIKKVLRVKLPDYMIPKLYFQVETIPLNINGKIDRVKLHELLDHKSNFHHIKIKNGIETSEMFYEQLCNIILNHLNKISNVELLQRETRIADLGIDSLVFTDIILSIEEKWNITFETEYYSYSEFNTIEDLYKYCSKQLQTKEK